MLACFGFAELLLALAFIFCDFDSFFRRTKNAIQDIV